MPATLPTVRQRVLNEPETGTVPVVAEVIQGGIFTTIFGALEKVLESAVKVALFPAATLISVYKSYLAYKDYRKSKNKNLKKQVSLAIELLATVGEIIAVTAAVAAFFGAAFLGAAAVPAIFLATIALKFVSHLAQTFYYGIKCLFGEAGTKQQEENINQFKSNFRATTVLGMVGTAIGLLLFAPAFNLLFLAGSAVTAVKVIAALVTGANAVYTGVSFYKMSQANNSAEQLKKPKKETQGDYVTLDDSPAEDHDQQNTHVVSQQAVLWKRVGFGFDEQDAAKLVSLENDGEGVLPAATKLRHKRDTANDLIARYQEPGHFEDLQHDHINDLLRKMEVCADNTVDPTQRSQLMIKFLQDAKQALLRDIGYQQIDEIDGTKGGIELDDKGQIPANQLPAAGFLDFQYEKRKDKLHAILLLEKLAQGVVKVKDDSGERIIKSVSELIEYFKQNNKDENVFKSYFNTAGRIQKLFLLVHHHMNLGPLQGDLDHAKSNANSRRGSLKKTK